MSAIDDLLSDYWRVEATGQTGDTPKAEPPQVTKLSAMVYLTDEMQVDAGIAPPEVIARVAERDRQAKASWRALPWWRRARIRLAIRRSDIQTRAHRAVRAWRGEDVD